MKLTLITEKDTYMFKHANIFVKVHNHLLAFNLSDSILDSTFSVLDRAIIPKKFIEIKIIYIR